MATDEASSAVSSGHGRPAPCRDNVCVHPSSLPSTRASDTPTLSTRPGLLLKAHQYFASPHEQHCQERN